MLGSDQDNDDGNSDSVLLVHPPHLLSCQIMVNHHDWQYNNKSSLIRMLISILSWNTIVLSVSRISKVLRKYTRILSVELSCEILRD